MFTSRNPLSPPPVLQLQAVAVSDKAKDYHYWYETNEEHFRKTAGHRISSRAGPDVFITRLKSKLTKESNAIYNKLANATWNVLEGDNPHGLDWQGLGQFYMVPADIGVHIKPLDLGGRVPHVPTSPAGKTHPKQVPISSRFTRGRGPTTTLASEVQAAQQEEEQEASNSTNDILDLVNIASSWREQQRLTLTL